MTINKKYQKIIDEINKINSPVRIVEIDEKSNSIEYSSVIKTYRNLRELDREEICRAYLVCKLVNVLKYDASNIELEKDYEAGRPKKISPRIDLILAQNNSTIFYFCEIKKPESFEADKKLIDGQLFKLSRMDERKSKFGLYYTVDFDEIENKIVEKIITIDFEKYNTYNDWLEDGSPSRSNKISSYFDKPKKELLIKNSKNDLRKTFSKNELSSLQNNLHNVLWGGGGSTDNDIFHALVKLILTKIYDEESTEEGKEYKFQIASFGKKNMELEPHTDVYDRLNKLYREAVEVKMHTPKKETEDLNVVDLNKIGLTKIIYAVQQLESFSFLEGRNSYEGIDLLGDFFEGIIRDGFKQSKGQFFTHPNIVKFLIYALKIDDLSIDLLNNEMRLPYIIDPAAGSGTFLIEVIKAITFSVKNKRKADLKNKVTIQNKYEELFLPDNQENRWAKEYIYGVETNFDLGTAIKVNMILHGDGNANIFIGDKKGDGLSPFNFYKKNEGLSILSSSEKDDLYFDKEINNKFDVIISNPPFSVDLSQEVKRFIDKNFIYSQKKNSENLFIERYYQLLKPQGRLGVVLPESVFDTAENKYIRLFIFKYFKIKAVVSLPQVTFAPFTSTKTSLLFAQKKTNEELKEYIDMWEHYESVFQKLKTRVTNYINVWIEGKKPSKYPSIKNHGKEETTKNLVKLIGNDFKKEDEKLLFLDILDKYREIIEDIIKVKNKKFVNENWIFEKITQNINYSFKIYGVDDVGYKRTKVKIKTRPNELYDVDENNSPKLNSKILDDIRKNIQWD